MEILRIGLRPELLPARSPGIALRRKRAGGAPRRAARTGGFAFSERTDGERNRALAVLVPSRTRSRAFAQLLVHATSCGAQCVQLGCRQPTQDLGLCLL